jgi:hypothetical protein
LGVPLLDPGRDGHHGVREDDEEEDADARVDQQLAVPVDLQQRLGLLDEQVLARLLGVGGDAEEWLDGPDAHHLEDRGEDHQTADEDAFPA